VCVGVDEGGEEGFREVLAVEVAGMEKGAAYTSLLRGLIDRGLRGVRLVVSDYHEGIKVAVAGKLPEAEWQRCVVHFERNVLAHVPASEMSEVAEDIKAVFKVRRQKTARALAEEFVESYGGRFPKAVKPRTSQPLHNKGDRNFASDPYRRPRSLAAADHRAPARSKTSRHFGE
jgi:putative transposase